MGAMSAEAARTGGLTAAASLRGGLTRPLRRRLGSPARMPRLHYRRHHPRRLPSRRPHRQSRPPQHGDARRRRLVESGRCVAVRAAAAISVCVCVSSPLGELCLLWSTRVFNSVSKFVPELRIAHRASSHSKYFWPLSKHKNLAVGQHHILRQ